MTVVPGRCIAVALLAAALLGCSLPATQLSSPAEQQDSTTCLTPGRWYRPEAQGPEPIAIRTILAQAEQAEIVLIGDHHGSRDDLYWQWQTLAALHTGGRNLVLGFEACPREVQPVLDQWVAGALSAHALFAQTNWIRNRNFPTELYRPLFEFARINRIPMRALNVDRRLPTAVNRHGWNGVPADRREGLSRPAPLAAVYVDMLFDVYRQHADLVDDIPPRARTVADFRHFVHAQTTWDRAMAEALAQPRSQAVATSPLVIGIVGVGHLQHGHGVAHQLRDLGINNILTLLPIEPGAACDNLPANLADAVFVLPEHPYKEPQ